jgi:hypothetical protein
LGFTVCAQNKRANVYFSFVWACIRLAPSCVCRNDAVRGRYRNSFAASVVLAWWSRTQKKITLPYFSWTSKAWRFSFYRNWRRGSYTNFKWPHMQEHICKIHMKHTHSGEWNVCDTYVKHMSSASENICEPYVKRMRNRLTYFATLCRFFFNPRGK